MEASNFLIVSRLSPLFLIRPVCVMCSQRDIANEAGSTILMVTHSEKVAASSDRIIYLVDGDIQGELKLGKVTVKSDKTDPREELQKRERKLRQWLDEMGW